MLKSAILAVLFAMTTMTILSYEVIRINANKIVPMDDVAEIKDMDSAPPMAVESVFQAMKHFGILRTKMLDAVSVEDGPTGTRAMTRKSAFSVCRVEFYKASFVSWAILGSTIAHEVAVHCNQNFLLAVVVGQIDQLKDFVLELVLASARKMESPKVISAIKDLQVFEFSYMLAPFYEVPAYNVEIDNAEFFSNEVYAPGLKQIKAEYMKDAKFLSVFLE